MKINSGLWTYRTYEQQMDSKESLPFNFADLHYQINRFIKEGLDPKSLFELMLGTLDYERILNFEISKAYAEKLKADQQVAVIA